jgi:hypothetical protein
MILTERISTPQLNKNIINFINNIGEKPQIKTELLQYDINHDHQEKDVNFISKQLETHLKERFNVLLSTVEYGIKNGHLVRQGTEVPFIESIKKGRDTIQKIDLRKIDAERENAEIVGFEKLDSFLSDPRTPLDSKMLSISPRGERGSKYQHNFYDIFTLKEKNGERYVELSRFSSGLTSEEYVKRLGERYKHPPQANPIIAPHGLSAEEIHKLLHVKHDYMDPSDFNKIWMSPLVQFYVKRYEENKDGGSFNAILNAADEAWGDKKSQYLSAGDYEPSSREIRIFEEKKVRQSGGQCPGKSGVDVSNSPYSVSEFANLTPDQHGKRTFECPECGKINVRPIYILIKNCQHCGSKKVAC